MQHSGKPASASGHGAGPCPQRGPSPQCQGWAGSGGIWPSTLCLWLPSPARDTCAGHQKTGRGLLAQQSLPVLLSWGERCRSSMMQDCLSLRPLVCKNLYPRVPGSPPPAQRGWSKLDFPNFWIAVLKTAVSFHPLPSHCIYGLPSFGMRHKSFINRVGFDGNTISLFSTNYTTTAPQLSIFLKT